MEADKSHFSQCIVQKSKIGAPIAPGHEVIAARGRVIDTARELTYVRIKSYPKVVAAVRTVTHRGEDTDGESIELRGHSRVLLSRYSTSAGGSGQEYFVVGCFWSWVVDEEDRYYVAGPMSRETFVKGFKPTSSYAEAPDYALRDAAGLAPIEDI
jgi:hypothetical protein